MPGGYGATTAERVSRGDDRRARATFTAEASPAVPVRPPVEAVFTIEPPPRGAQGVGIAFFVPSRTARGTFTR